MRGRGEAAGPGGGGGWRAARARGCSGSGFDSGEHVGRAASAGPGGACVVSGGHVALSGRERAIRCALGDACSRCGGMGSCRVIVIVSYIYIYYINDSDCSERANLGCDPSLSVV